MAMNTNFNYELNLAQRPFVNTTIPMVIAAAFIAIIVLFTAFNAFVLVSAESDHQGFQDQVAATSTRMDDMRAQIDKIDEELANKDFSELRREVNYSQALIKRRSMSWTRLFDRLEEIAPPDLRMLRISPTYSVDAIDMIWRVEVPNQEVIRRFIDALEESPYFDDIALQSETPNSDGNGIIWEMNLIYVEEQ